MKTAWFIFTFWIIPAAQEPPWFYGLIPSREAATVPIVQNLPLQYDSREACMEDIPGVISRGEVKKVLQEKAAAYICIEAVIP